eukprot:17044-Prymnesium_polylepis.1
MRSIVEPCSSASSPSSRASSDSCTESSCRAKSFSNAVNWSFFPSTNASRTRLSLALSSSLLTCDRERCDGANGSAPW